MPQDTRSDEELIENLKTGCLDCLRVLYERYKTSIFNYLYHFLGDKHNAEDCTQDVFIHLYQKASLYSPSSKFSSWLYRMAKNLALDTLRRNKVRRAASFDARVEESEAGSETSTGLENFLKSQAPDARETMASEELKQILRKGLLKLNEKDREVILLCDIQGLPHSQVGEILGYPAKTVTVKLYRARQRLAKVLGLTQDDL